MPQIKITSSCNGVVTNVTEKEVSHAAAKRVLDFFDELRIKRDRIEKKMAKRLINK